MRETARTRYESEYDDKIYWERVKRNLGWLGDTDEEARKRQTKLRDTVIGVAGAGGIGGSMVERLARLGVLRLKVADFDTFEYSNINRQLGAGVRSVGRNKAEVVAEYVHEMTPDVAIDVFPEGITEESAAEFVEGCDYVLDEIEPYEFRPRYALHRAFRASESVNFMLTGYVFGNRTFLWKWTRDSMPVEEFIGLPDDAEMNERTAEHLIGRLIPETPGYPGAAMQRRWLIEEQECPIVPGAPPMSQGLLTDRMMLAITGIEDETDSVRLPVSPGYAMVDSRTWTAKIVEATL
ncbi:ThiF family adenylyltransferase [Actinoallomurus iriomotensis]|uniref:Molybdopterin biosynthesis protein MoeB n=1 Tax=Actinoallomurus iriomotensis TaxID=478107 RepID=A0A9W6VSW2_9ACTN|nr:ThiF family adenylyltransferase [Actinoallomurus iriomotensis]GLY83798.1 molybdopterin biosynthesis protein MoeB [Actinoallomurus iriomotensis]